MVSQLLPIVKPENPIKEHYNFMGWYTNQELTEEYDFENQVPPADNMILYAKWMQKTYTVTYETGEGSAVAANVYAYGEDMEVPENPSREGYTFTDWYEDEELTKVYTFGKMPAKDIVLYAGWAEKIEDPSKGNITPNTTNTTAATNSGGQLTAVYRKAVANNKAKKVIAKNVKSITLYTKKLKTAQLSINGSNGSVWWGSSNVAVAKVSQKGKVTAVGKGTAYITGKVDGVNYRCKIVVKKAKITLERKNHTVKMRLGMKPRIRVNVVPKGVVSYKTSKKKIVSISKQGMLKAKAAGTATITIKANGIKKKCKVIVKR